LKETLMFFAVDCPRHNARVLLFTRDVTEVRTTPGGIEVHYRCFCGHGGVWLTGSASPAPRTVNAAQAGTADR
jgi:hypothetical protein